MIDQIQQAVVDKFNQKPMNTISKKEVVYEITFKIVKDEKWGLSCKQFATKKAYLTDELTGYSFEYMERLLKLYEEGKI